MNTYQLLTLAVLALLFVAGIVSFWRQKLRRRDVLGWSLVLVAAAVATIWPDSTSALARGLGIGRGADLISYLSVLAMLMGFWVVFARFRAQEREMTLLVRKLALLEAEARHATGEDDD